MPKRDWTPEELDTVIEETTAFGSMRELVNAMRGDDGYQQQYTPTLRPDCCCDPQLSEGLHAVREEVQRLGFAVFPDDNTFAPARDAGSADAPDLDSLTVEELQQGPSMPEHEPDDEYILDL